MNARPGQGRRPFRIALKPTIGIALLGLLALRAAAQAQTAEGPLTYVPQLNAVHVEPSAAPGDKPADDSQDQPSKVRSRRSEPADFNRSIYYKNKLEFSWEGGWQPNNIPFVFGLFIGHSDKLSGL